MTFALTFSQYFNYKQKTDEIKFVKTVKTKNDENWFPGIIAVKWQLTQKTNKPIRYDKRVECKKECNLVECDNVLSCTMPWIFQDCPSLVNPGRFGKKTNECPATFTSQQKTTYISYKREMVIKYLIRRCSVSTELHTVETSTPSYRVE